MLSFSIILTTLATFTAASPLAARTDSCPAPMGSETAGNFDSTRSIYNQANGAPVPSGYTRIGSAPAIAAASSASYITYKTLNGYDTVTCSKFCDSYLGCNTFNVYVERDPQVPPTTSCQNPASTAVYQCALYRAVLDASSLTNNGQYREQFHVVIAGSYLYTKNAPPAVTGYSGPYPYGNKAIVDPANYLTYETFPSQQTYDPNVCAGRCAQITKDNQARGKLTDVCIFFDAYIAYETGKAPVFTCAYYKSKEDSSKATNSGYTNNGITYSIGNSNGYALN